MAEIGLAIVKGTITGVADGASMKITEEIIKKYARKTRIGRVTLVLSIIIDYNVAPTMDETLADIKRILEEYKREEVGREFIVVNDVKMEVISLSLVPLPLYEYDEPQIEDNFYEKECEEGDKEEIYGRQYVRRIIIVLIPDDITEKTFKAIKQLVLYIATVFQGKAKVFTSIRIYPVEEINLNKIMKKLTKNKYFLIEVGTHFIDKNKPVRFLKTTFLLKDVDYIEELGKILLRRFPFTLI